MKNKKQKQNCIIIHGCPSNAEKSKNPRTRTYDKHWIPWVKKELIKKGIETKVPLMPRPWEPVYENFKEKFEKYPVLKNTILIGHSCGTAFLVRWLGESKRRIKKLILVAPWKILRKNYKNNMARKEFYNFQIDKTIKSRAEKIIMFTSDDEEEEGIKSLNIFQKAFGGKIVELEKHGHYVFKDMRTEEFPELVEEVISEK